MTRLDVKKAMEAYLQGGHTLEMLSKWLKENDDALRAMDDSIAVERVDELGDGITDFKDGVIKNEKDLRKTWRRMLNKILYT